MRTLLHHVTSHSPGCWHAVKLTRFDMTYRVSPGVSVHSSIIQQQQLNNTWQPAWVPEHANKLSPGDATVLGLITTQATNKATHFLVERREHDTFLVTKRSARTTQAMRLLPNTCNDSTKRCLLEREAQSPPGYTSFIASVFPKAVLVTIKN